MRKSYYIKVLKDYEELSLVAAELFTEIVSETLKKSDTCKIALSGGGTPERMYEILASTEFRTRIPWEYLHIFWGDERCVPIDDPRSNQMMALRTLLKHVPIKKENIHWINCKNDPHKAAKQYEKDLRSVFGENPQFTFDLILLGLGADGHTASLFPKNPALKEKKRWVLVVKRDSEPFMRITLTLPVINRARVVLFLVSGKEKASILKEVFSDDSDPLKVPAKLINPQLGKLIWLVDRRAAQLILTVSGDSFLSQNP